MMRDEPAAVAAPRGIPREVGAAPGQDTYPPQPDAARSVHSGRAASSVEPW